MSVGRVGASPQKANLRTLFDIEEVPGSIPGTPTILRTEKVVLFWFGDDSGIGWFGTCRPIDWTARAN
jgi:hypothetical protein